MNVKGETISGNIPDFRSPFFFLAHSQTTPEKDLAKIFDKHAGDTCNCMAQCPFSTYSGRAPSKGYDIRGLLIWCSRAHLTWGVMISPILWRYERMLIRAVPAIIFVISSPASRLILLHVLLLPFLFHVSDVLCVIYWARKTGLNPINEARDQKQKTLPSRALT